MFGKPSSIGANKWHFLAAFDHHEPRFPSPSSSCSLESSGTTKSGIYVAVAPYPACAQNCSPTVMRRVKVTVCVSVIVYLWARAAFCRFDQADPLWKGSPWSDMPAEEDGRKGSRGGLPELLVREAGVDGRKFEELVSQWACMCVCVWTLMSSQAFHVEMASNLKVADFEEKEPEPSWVTLAERLSSGKMRRGSWMRNFGTWGCRWGRRANDGEGKTWRKKG